MRAMILQKAPAAAVTSPNNALLPAFQGSPQEGRKINHCTPYMSLYDPEILRPSICLVCLCILFRVTQQLRRKHYIQLLPE